VKPILERWNNNSRGLRVTPQPCEHPFWLLGTMHDVFVSRGQYAARVTPPQPLTIASAESRLIPLVAQSRQKSQQRLLYSRFDLAKILTVWPNRQIMHRCRKQEDCDDHPGNPIESGFKNSLFQKMP